MRGPSRHGAATLDDVARRAEVSAMTVSNALNHPARLSPETLARVRDAIEELGYRPNRSARTLRSQTSRLVGVRVERSRQDRAALLLDQFLHALAESASSLGYHLILCHAAGDSAELAAYQELRQTTAVDAFVLTGAHRDDARMAWLREQGVTFASFGRSWDADPDGPGAFSWVDVDGAAGIRAAVEHLATQGHTEIGFVGWPEDSELGRDRLRGWQEACTALGLPARVRAHVVDEFDAGRDVAHRLLDAPRGGPVPTALVCVSDTLALGVLRTLSERGLRAGPDVAVTGFDNSPSAALTTPGLTSIDQPLADVAAELVRILDAELSGVAATAASPAQTLLPPRLVVRDSSLSR
ncbi:transcriptional regulator, LacI family [Nocardioides scoriae]|uniref:Transcriptional regulator, LacI family n=1 Tax=Nocardioides scoriae TaxID=642780 RepID=A0A1H1RDZ7_9ACTN|nr:LacI family DNA-binding transcriptional regulator [Nocardioides scoriae]SDS33997.1 transcriptional regulator, LacI family [Nocardioides scoriae]